MDYIATFFTHSGAVKYKKHMTSLGISVELLPVPRRLSSDCGIGARFSTGREIRHLISEDIDKLFEVEKEGERLLYSSDSD
jgi:hypothetical protein